jgi:acetyl esterase
VTRPLPFRIRALFAAVGLLMKSGLLSTPENELKKPHAQRLLSRAPHLACGPGDRTIRTDDCVVEGRGGPIPVRVYVRPDLKPDAPGYLFIHGGGFVNYGLDFTDYVQRALAARTGCVVVGLSYRLAPEHPFPAGLEDCQDVLRWMAKTRPQRMDRERIAVGGESAGGNLTAALGIWARNEPKAPRISHLTLGYPFADGTLSALDWDSCRIPGLNRSAGEFMVRVYAGEQQATNPLFSILHADLHGLPPTLVITCEYDPLRTDGIRLAAALNQAGVETLHRHYDNMPHGFLVFPRLTRTADESLELMAAETRRHLHYQA